MPTVLGHALVAATGGRLYASRPLPARFWVAALACSLLPDADVAGFAAGVDYDHVLGHRGLSHSLPCAALAGAAAAWWVRSGSPDQRIWALWLLFAALTASHGVLDALTDGGLGVAFLAPFDDTRYFLPWRPLHVSPIGLTAFLRPYGARVLLSEATWLGVPCLLLLISAAIVRSRRGG